MRVPVQENIDIIRRSIGWDVLKAKFQSAPHKIEHQRPLEITVAISADNREPWSNRTQLIQNRFRANIAKVPDLIGVFRHLLHALRQTIVRVGENKDTLVFGFSVRSHVAL